MSKFDFRMIAEKIGNGVGIDGSGNLIATVTGAEAIYAEVLSGRDFVAGNGNEGQVTAQGTPDMTVRVATGGVAYDSSGARAAFSSANSVTIADADSTNGRRDFVVVAANGSIVVRQGTPNATPVDPTTQAGDVPLARITVDANATSIGSAKITDLRYRTPIAITAVGASETDATFTGDGSTTVFTLPNPVVPGYERAARVVAGGQICEWNNSPTANNQFKIVGNQLTVGSVGDPVPDQVEITVAFLKAL